MTETRGDHAAGSLCGFDRAGCNDELITVVALFRFHRRNEHALLRQQEKVEYHEQEYRPVVASGGAAGRW
jgi:hypothetical protein